MAELAYRTALIVGVGDGLSARWREYSQKRA